MPAIIQGIEALESIHRDASLPEHLYDPAHVVYLPLTAGQAQMGVLVQVSGAVGPIYLQPDPVQSVNEPEQLFFLEQAGLREPLHQVKNNVYVVPADLLEEPQLVVVPVLQPFREDP